MVKLSLCIEPLFPEVDFYDRIPLAAELGFEAIEFWSPDDRDLERIARLAAANRLEIATCCARDAWGNCMDGPAETIVANIRQSVKIAQDLGCPSLIVLSGNSWGQPEAQKQALIENLKRAGEVAARENIRLNLEALNSRVDHKGYFLDSSYTGFEIIESVNCPQVKLLYDVYHMQIMEGNIIENITQNLDYIGHFHSAGVPGRHEHFSGELDYYNIVKAIQATGYTGFFGIEYWPSYDHRQSVVEVRRHLSAGFKP